MRSICDLKIERLGHTSDELIYHKILMYWVPYTRQQNNLLWLKQSGSG